MLTEKMKRQKKIFNLEDAHGSAVLSKVREVVLGEKLICTAKVDHHASLRSVAELFKGLKDENSKRNFEVTMVKGRTFKAINDMSIYMYNELH